MASICYLPRLSLYVAAVRLAVYDATMVPASVILPKDRVKRLESACTGHSRCRCLVLPLTRKRSFPSFFSLTDDIRSVIYHRPLEIICADIFT